MRTVHSEGTPPKRREHCYSQLGLLAALFVLSCAAPARAQTHGLNAEYFDNRHLSGSPVSNRVDATIEFDWADAGPFGTFSNEFGVRWVGEVEAQYTEPYTLYCDVDDGVRLWLDEQLIIDDWQINGSHEISATVNLVAGQRYLLRVEYFENSADAHAMLGWSSPSTTKQAIPASQLYAVPTDSDGNGLPDLWEAAYFSIQGVDPQADPDNDGLSNLQEWQLRRDPTDPLWWGLPNEWSHGVVGLARGDASHTNDVFAVGSTGIGGTTDDIWGQYDSFQFVYQPLEGNGEIVARVLGMDGGGFWAKAAVMVRESPSAVSAYGLMAVTRNGELAFEGRPTADGWSQHTSGAVVGNSYWVKLVRQGDLLAGYSSADGTSWTEVGTLQCGPLPRTVYVGLAVSSWLEESLCIGFLDNVQVVTNSTMGTGSGLAADYYDNQYLVGAPELSRVDQRIGFDWGNDAPAGLAEADHFSVRWTGELEAQYTEPYTIYAQSDDGVRVWVNEQLVIDDWNIHGLEESEATLNLVAGQKYLIRVEYFEYDGAAAVKLLWSSSSTLKQIIPQSQLHPVPTDSDGNGLPDAWEVAWFGQIGVDAQGDPDDDGLSNVEEWENQGDPNSPLMQGLPSGWFQGAVGLSRGDAGYSNGVFRVSSTGVWYYDDIWYQSDGFHFIFRSLSGDGEITARVLGFEGGGWVAKSGVMIRESLSADSAHAIMVISRELGAAFEGRSLKGDWTQHTDGEYVATPYWVRLARHGDVLTGYSSADGTNWTWVGTQECPSMATNAYVGLVVSSAAVDDLCEAQLDHVQVNALTNAAPDPVVGTGDGLAASYFENRTLTGTPVLQRVDWTVNFFWWYGSSIAALDDFSVRWTGELQAQYTGQYKLFLETDDGVRVWVNEQLVIDDWTTHGTKENSVTLNVIAGEHYLIRVEYFEYLYTAVAKLWWSSPLTPKQIIPRSQLYSQYTDTDADGLPDIWELIYFGNLSSDGTQDPDGDGLNNAQEFVAHTCPTDPDTDGDGIPDAWEVAHGLDASFDDANADLDEDGLSNLQEYELQTDPTRADSDGDSLPDLLEAEYLGTDPNTATPGLLTEAAAVDGAAGEPILGGWQVDGTALCGTGRRGLVEYTVTTASADKYMLELEGGQNLPNSLRTNLNVRLSVDGEDLPRQVLSVDAGGSGVIQSVTPYLQAGTHTVQLLWDDVAEYSSLRIERLVLLSVSGADANGNGLKDWVENVLIAESGLDTNTVLTSIESPLCIEGRDPYLTMMEVKSGRPGQLTNTVVVGPNTGARWHANVPLLPGQTSLQLSYQNGAFTQTRQLHWQPVNVLTSPNLTVRQGSSLRLGAEPEDSPNGTMTITIGTDELTGAADEALPYQFVQPGTCTVSCVYTPTNGPTQSRSIQVTVVGYQFPDEPACWVGFSRDWALTNVPAGSMIEGDPRMTFSQTDTGTEKTVSLLTLEKEPRSLVSRLGTDGPILDAVRVQAFNFWFANDTYARVVETYEDGSTLVEILLVESPVIPDVSARLDVIVGGVMFEDGTLNKVLTAADFDALGECRVRFIRPATAETSICHSLTVLQGAVTVGYLQ